MKWRVLDERVVHDASPWVTIREQDVMLPNGDTLTDYILFDERDGCLVFAVTDQGRVILLEQYRHGRGDREVGLPSGFLDDTEDPLDTARRELLEETGYAGDHWTHLGSLFTDSNRGSQLFHFFLARDVAPIGSPDRGPGEVDIDVRLMSLDELTDYLVRSNGNIGMAAMTGILLGMAELEREK